PARPRCRPARAVFRRGVKAAIGALALIAGGLLSPAPARAETPTPSIADTGRLAGAPRLDDPPIATAPAGAPMIVQVRLNGVDTGSVLQFEFRDGEVAAPRATLDAL